jgi:hypothetical protein
VEEGDQAEPSACPSSESFPVNDEQREAIQRILGNDAEIIRLPIPQRTDEMMESFRRFSAARHGVPIEQTEIVEDC